MATHLTLRSKNTENTVNTEQKVKSDEQVHRISYNIFIRVSMEDLIIIFYVQITYKDKVNHCLKSLLVF